MTEHRLTRLLAHHAAEVRVGPAPVHAVRAARARARRTRRLGFLAAVGASAAVTAVVVGLTSATPPQGPTSTASPATTPETSAPEPQPDTARPGHRLVGLDDVAVEVPTSWGTNATRCGTPVRDTVVVDQGAICTALVPWPDDVTSIGLRRPYRGEDLDALTTGEVAGLPALVGELACAAPVCSRVAVLTEHDVVVQVDSTAGRAAVDAAFDTVRVLERHVPVPELDAVVGARGRSVAAYVEALIEAGLRARVVEVVDRRIDPGFVLDARPAAGTVVAPGSTVVLEVVAPRDGPADEVALGLGWEGDGYDDRYGWLEDEELRADPTLRLRVGDRVWTYAEGRPLLRRTYAAALEGDALDVSEWTDGPSHPRAWDAVRPGTSRLALSIEVDGRRMTLATVTVVVT
jgi:hypothetical protein